MVSNRGVEENPVAGDTVNLVPVKQGPVVRSAAALQPFDLIKGRGIEDVLDRSHPSGSVGRECRINVAVRRPFVSAPPVLKEAKRLAQPVHLEVRDPRVLLAVAVNLATPVLAPVRTTDPAIDLAEPLFRIAEPANPVFDLTTDTAVLDMLHVVVLAIGDEAAHRVVAEVHVDGVITISDIPRTDSVHGAKW